MIKKSPPHTMNTVAKSWNQLTRQQRRKHMKEATSFPGVFCEPEHTESDWQTFANKPPTKPETIL